MPYLAGAAVAIFNQVGFRAAFGHDDMARIGGWICDHEIGWVVRTMAADGAEAFDGDTQAAGYPVNVVDVTGAGDTFGSALTWCLGEGRPFAEALHFSIAAASRSVKIHGPRGGKAAADEVLAWRRERRGL